MQSVIEFLLIFLPFSFFRAKKAVTLPGYHFVDRRLDITKHNKDYTSVEQYEISIARHPAPR